MTMRGTRLLVWATSLVVCAVGVAGGFFAQPSWAQGKQEKVVAVNVLDEQGRQVTGLTAENFRGKYRGKPVKIVSATWDAGPRRIVILLDRSSSMFWGDKWKVARKAAEDVVFYGPPGNDVAMVLFGMQPEEVVGFDRGRSGVAQRLGELMQSREEGRGRTGLFNALLEGVRLLEPSQTGDTLYVVTDAGENASRMKRKTLERAVFCSGARVFVFYLSDRAPNVWDREYFRGADATGELVRGTGGFAVAPTQSSGPFWQAPDYNLTPEQEQQVAADARRLYEFVASYYRVEVELPRQLDKTREWDLEVVDGVGKRMKDVR
ncbi:MAG: VWA domain-containing protein, partial [Acidobacteria bacterium]|nr:VWA domain-containing protein [Acidobacteriota bacterium]